MDLQLNYWMISCVILWVSIKWLLSVYILECNIPLGMEDDSIPDDNIRASTTINYSGYESYKARLDGSGAWVADQGDNTPWIEADIGSPATVSGLVSQGDGGDGSYDDWVTSLLVSFKLSSDEGGAGTFIEDDNGIKVGMDILSTMIIE